MVLKPRRMITIEQLRKRNESEKENTSRSSISCSILLREVVENATESFLEALDERIDSFDRARLNWTGPESTEGPFIEEHFLSIDFAFLLFHIDILLLLNLLCFHQLSIVSLHSHQLLVSSRFNDESLQRHYLILSRQSIDTFSNT